MRIIHVARRFTPASWGGTETVIAALVKEQLLMGHQAELLCTAALDRPGSETACGVPVRRFPYTYARIPCPAGVRAALDRKGGNPLSPRLLAALLSAPRTDVFHCHTMQRLAAHVRVASRLRKIPYAVQLHGGEFAVPADEVKEMLAPTAKSLDWGKIPSVLLGTRRFLKDASLVLVLSEEEERRARSALPGVRVERLPNGVDPCHADGGDGTRARMRWGVPLDAPLILTVARVDPQKGQEFIPDVLAANPGAHAVLAGPVTVPGYDAKVKERGSALGVLPRIHFTGPLLPLSAEIADLYRAATVFLLPSRHEPFGIVVLEAWAAGVPVVASRVGGLASLVKDGVSGFLVPAGEPQGFASAATRLIQDRNLAASFVEAARREVREQYSWPAVAARLENFYREVLERK